MEDTSIKKYAEMLFIAEQERNAIPPLSEIVELTVDDAYAIQLANVQQMIQHGNTISGKKIGLTSPGIQKQLGISEPDYGHLFQGMDCPDGNVPAGSLIQPKIEAEIAFILKEDLAGGNVTSEDVRKATDYVCAAFEIIDSRVADWKIKLVDTISDNASSGRYVLGNEKIPLGLIDLSAVEMELYQNGEMVGKGSGSAVAGDPCNAVAWLANRLWGYGVTLKKGEVILSGAFSAAPLAFKGDSFQAKFSTLGTVTAKFV